MILLYSGQRNLRPQLRRYHHSRSKPSFTILDLSFYASHDSYGWRSSVGRHRGGCLLQGFITDDYGEQHLTLVDWARHWAQFFLGKTTPARTGVLLIFDVIKPRLEAGNITLPLRGENRRAQLLQARHQSGCIRRKEGGYECDYQCSSVAPEVVSPY